jgi:hypothetical protein
VRRSLCTVLSAAAVALVPAGCGGGDDQLARFSDRERPVAQTVLDYSAAARTRDAKTVCSDILARSATAPLGRECPVRMAAALRSIDEQGLEVVAVRFVGDTAIATVVTGAGKNPRSGSLALVLEGDRWRIARVGPLPPPGADAGR